MIARNGLKEPSSWQFTTSRCLKLTQIGTVIFLNLIVVPLTTSLDGKCLSDVSTVFPSRLQQPGLNAPEKLWWAKEITPDFHVCGRLSERQIKLAMDAGFKSIVSLFTYPAGDPGGSFGGDYLPTTEQEREIVRKATDLQFINLLEPLDEWASVEAIELFTSIVPKLKTPALLRCDRGYTITFVTLLYLANQTRHNPDFEPKIYVKDFFKISNSMGLDFLSRIPMEVIADVTGETLPKLCDIPKPNFVPQDWLDYWFAHPVYYNLFLAGQITKSHLGPLEEFGYNSVINLRLGLTHNMSASQEEVPLLNVQSGTGTYGNVDHLHRQHDIRLRQTLINASRPNTFISKNSDVNFEFSNPHEFGDSVGYNEALEAAAFKDSSLMYYHMPMVSIDDLDGFFRRHKDELLEISSKGSVLIHCSDGARSAYLTVLLAAVQYDLSFNWCLQRLKEMGYGMPLEKTPEIYTVFHLWLQKSSEVIRNEL